MKLRSVPQLIVKVKLNTLLLHYCPLMVSFDIENPYSWLISSPKKSFVVRANSDRERQEWLAHLDRCVYHCRNTNQSQSNAVAAHWVPDDRSDTCMHCRATKFSAYNRKHV